MDIDGEEEGEYEEYTWAGQTRVRVTTMLEGGLAGQSQGQWSDGQCLTVMTRWFISVW